VYGHDAAGMRFSPLDQINLTNVDRLRRAWTYHTGEHPSTSCPRGQRQIAFETTPVIVNGMLYLSTPANRIVALDPVSGRELWKFDPRSKAVGALKYRAHRGIAYWPGDKHAAPRVLFGTLDGRLIALNAKTRLEVPGFGKEGEVNLRQDVAEDFPDSIYAETSPPAIHGDLVITGAEVPESPGLGPRGDVRAWDVRTGKLDGLSISLRSRVNPDTKPGKGMVGKIELV
jgi:glucose dehydrogenase